MTSEKFELYKEDFASFIYLLTSIKYPPKVSTSTLSSEYFFLEKNLRKLFEIYHKVFEKEVSAIFIKKHPRQVGFSFFCSFYLLYKCYFNRSYSAAIVCDLSSSKKTMNEICDLLKILEQIIPFSLLKDKLNQQIDFSNGSKIKVFSSTTYDFRGKSEIDIIIFDNCKVVNKDKFNYFTANLIDSSMITKQLIVNLSQSNSDFIKECETNFLNKANFLNIE